jgi:hypothetical protein
VHWPLLQHGAGGAGRCRHFSLRLRVTQPHATKLPVRSTRRPARAAPGSAEPARRDGAKRPRAAAAEALEAGRKPRHLKGQPRRRGAMTRATNVFHSDQSSRRLELQTRALRCHGDGARVLHRAPRAARRLVAQSELRRRHGRQPDPAGCLDQGEGAAAAFRLPPPPPSSVSARPS